MNEHDEHDDLRRHEDMRRFLERRAHERLERMRRLRLWRWVVTFDVRRRP